ncbi:unnamed protein product [Phytophthora lilii]|uniref:Unnamed protein product n=1 Tax=Phytophthora lilii TaxID=2077276 RepID=A0A9W7CFZ3_9STRA|nr:unnamed protein product [Phytophthora lilii]
MLRPPSTPMFSNDSPVLQPEDDEFTTGLGNYSLVTPRRLSNDGNQALSPPPPPPPPIHNSDSTVRRPMVARNAASMPQSPSVKSIASSKRVGAVKPKGLNRVHEDPPGNQSTDKPTPSVHPIDTLSKKLRQQAMELTKVYEELEKQNLQIDAYKQQIQDQKRELERLRITRSKSMDSSSKEPTSTRATALGQQKRAAQMMIGTPSTGASLGQKRGELDRKLKEAEREKKKYELAAKRIEKALVELQVFQNDRMERLLPREGVSNQRENDMGDLESVLDEQRAYIRVLEEAVHLKATDFEVTGHEELLVVLAELRHTIYEQEKDVEQKSNLLVSTQQQLEQEQQEHSATENLLVNAQKQQEVMAQRFHEQESALHSQLDDTRRQIEQMSNHLDQLQGAATDAHRTEEALQSRLIAATKSQNLIETKLDDATRNIKTLQQQLGAVNTKYEEVKLQTVSLQEECTKKQSHLDEMNSLQEELLSSVDKYVGKVKKSRDKVERLEAELQACQEKEKLAHKQADDAVRSSDERLATLQIEVDAVKQREQQVQAQYTALQQENQRLESTLREMQQRLQNQAQENSEQQQEITTKQEKCHLIEEAAVELESALSTALRMILEKATVSTQERSSNDGDVTDSDDYTFLLDDSVLSKLRRTSEVEAYALQVDSMNEQLCRAEAECEAYHALEQHTAIQEKALEAKEALIYDLSSEKDRLVEVEKAYSDQVATNARYSEQLEDLQEATREQRKYAEELEFALENAATFAEQQNECNQKLNVQLALLETSKREQVGYVKTLQEQNSAFSNRFMKLVKQYAALLRPVAATNRSLQDHINRFDTELQNGDVLRLLQLFPALLEQYISACIGRPEQDHVTDARKRGQQSVNSVPTKIPSQRSIEWSSAKPRRCHQYLEMATPTWHPPTPEPSVSKTLESPVSPPLDATATRKPACFIATEKEEAQLAEQLELIRGAFQSYKEDVETSG